MMSSVLPTRLRNWIRTAAPGLIGPVARSANDYATHLPVLIGLGKRMRINSVLELGCGHYSTRTFLNTKTFADLKVLDSYETDDNWATALKDVTTDARANIHVVPAPMADVIDHIDLHAYDLIFVDDSTSEQDRVATIRALARRKPPDSLIVIHDFEVQSYSDAGRAFRHRYAIKCFNPETGVIWQNDAGLRDVLREIDSVIKRHAGYFQPDDLDSWLHAFS